MILAEKTRRLYQREFGDGQDYDAAWAGIFVKAETCGNVRCRYSDGERGDVWRSHSGDNAAMSGAAIRMENAAMSGAAIRMENAAMSGAAIRCGQRSDVRCSHPCGECGDVRCSYSDGERGDVWCSHPCKTTTLCKQCPWPPDTLSLRGRSNPALSTLSPERIGGKNQNTVDCCIMADGLLRQAGIDLSRNDQGQDRLDEDRDDIRKPQGGDSAGFSFRRASLVGIGLWGLRSRFSCSRLSEILSRMSLAFDLSARRRMQCASLRGVFVRMVMFCTRYGRCSLAKIRLTGFDFTVLSSLLT